MTDYKPGTEIGVACDVNPGPFSGERLISFETVNGVISGFVREPDDLREVHGQWYVRAVVLSEIDGDLEVKIRGSFFTTNGLATISRQTVLAA